MNHLVIMLVLLAALLHATWNFLAKRVGNSPGFLWISGTISALLYVPVLLTIILLYRPQLSLLQYIFILGTACLHVGYFFFLQRGYGAGDLSLAYPLARGTGPLISSIGAIILLHERPSSFGLLGMVLLVGGVLALVGNPIRILRSGADTRVVIGYALITSLFIAVYTIWDKYAVSVLLIMPLLLDGVSSIARALLLTPSVLGRWDKAGETWRKYWREALGVAILSPMAYLLVLFALTTSPVSYVAPLRECSVLIGTFMGARFLAEKHTWRRLGAACVILSGIVLLALG